MTASVSVRGVSHRFGGFTALRGVTLEIDAGRFAVLLGPSGCGKTTLLSVLGGFITPSEGTVAIGGEDVTRLSPAKRPTTTVFQDYALFPHMRLGANVGFGLRMRGRRRSAREDKAREMLALVGLADAFDKFPHELSGGQRQRVALARALAVEPDVLLLDEPLGALDSKLRRQMQDELKAIQRRVGTTFVHVTHDQEEALAIADDVIVMDAGRIMDSGLPETVYRSPSCVFSANFMGEANLLDAVVAARGTADVQLSTPLGALSIPSSAASKVAARVGDSVVLCFRPEHVVAKDDPRALDLGPVVLEAESFLGSLRRCVLVPERAPALRIIAHLPYAVDSGGADMTRLRVDGTALIILPRDE